MKIDTEQWIERIEVEGEQHQILHSHYTKEMASKFVIHRNSANPLRSKYNILIADLVRVMRNVSQKCPDEERKLKVEEYIRRMQYSGYTKRERAEVYKKAKAKFDDMIKKSNDGTQPLYRSKDWHANERKEMKKTKKKEWYTRDGSEAVFFVETTPDGTHRRSLQESLQKCWTESESHRKNWQDGQSSTNKIKPIQEKRLQ